MGKKIVAAGDRVYLKFFDLDFFHERAKQAGAELQPCRSLDERKFKEEIADADALILIDRPISRSHIERMTTCKIVLALEVGYDFIDVGACTEKGIIVSNVPAYCTKEVSLHAFTLLLAVHRKLNLLMEETAGGGWDYNLCKPLFFPEGHKIGIIGLGRIGRQMIPKARAFGMEPIAYDPYLPDDIFDLYGVRRCYELDDLLCEADYVTLHVPLTDETCHMIGSRELGLMNQHAVLINTCRGKVVEEKALYNALKKGNIAGAGLDVLEREPPDKGTPLLNCSNCIVTPHVAWYSEQSIERLREQGMDEVVRVLNGKRPWYAANPEVLFHENGL
jgi:D-3-phosphoglycerate dehydrogenase